MKELGDYKNKKVLVLGLARSGVAAATLLHDLGAFVTVNDAKKLEENDEAKELLEEGITVITGSHPLELLEEGFTLIVKNPGIPYTNPILEKALSMSIPIITDVELAYQVSEADIIGITGSNGKTTTTTMIYDIFEKESPNTAKLAGNIGFPASEVVRNATNKDVLVTELSSFQLMGIDEFQPKVALITNIFDSHLDYHGTREAYIEAKWMIQKNMTSSDILILNKEQNELVELAKQTEAKVSYFSSKRVLEQGAYLENNKLMYDSEEIMPVDKLGIPGEHNIENALAAISVAKARGVSTASIVEGLTRFTGVPHRTAFVGHINGLDVYNDSKATNILATQRALSGFDNSSLILIAGGLDRGNDFDDLIPNITGLKGIVLLGETKNKLAEVAKCAGVKNIECVSDMSEAVSMAYQLGSNGDTILLSPACASWDMYSNFEIRGETFIDEINKQAGN